MDRHKPAMSHSQAFEESENVGRNASANPTMGDIIATRYHRRDLLKNSLAVAAITATVSPLALAAGRRAKAATPEASFGFTEIEAGVDETHHVAPGYRADILIRWGDPVLPGAPAFDPNAQTAAAQKQQFGYNNDFMGYFPLEGSSEHGLLVVNHEYTNEEMMFPASRVRRTPRRRLRPDDAGHGGRRDGRAWRLGARDPQGRRPLAGGAGQQVQPAHHHLRHRDGAHRPGGRPCAPADQGRPHRQEGGRHGQQLRRRRDALGHLAQRRGEFPRLFLGQGRRGFAAGRQPQALWRTQQLVQLGRLLRPLGRHQGAQRGAPLRLDGGDRPDRPHLDAQEADGHGPVQARGCGRRCQQGRQGRGLHGRRRAVRLPLPLRQCRYVRPEQSRRQHGPAGRGHAIGREVQ